MSDLAPFIGTALVGLIFVAAVLILRRFGLTLRRFRHGKTEVEFSESSITQTAGIAENYPSKAARDFVVVLRPDAKEDCDSLDLPPEEVIDFINEEVKRHPILFGTAFSSLPLGFHHYVLLLSWDRTNANIERILNRSEAYPLNDAWTETLSKYRKATILPYRNKFIPEEITLYDVKHAIINFRQMVLEVDRFIHLISTEKLPIPGSYREITTLFTEAEISFSNEDIPVTLARLEAILSIIHKIIITCAPQGLQSSKIDFDERPLMEKPKISQRSILIAEDDPGVLKCMTQFFSKAGYFVVSFDNVPDALKALVDIDFDIVLTDLVMPGKDGRELVIAARKSSEKTVVIVFTGYSYASHVAELYEAGAHEVLQKPMRLDKLLQKIESIFC